MIPGLGKAEFRREELANSYPRRNQIFSRLIIPSKKNGKFNITQLEREPEGSLKPSMSRYIVVGL